jgi:putative flippase GtrA
MIRRQLISFVAIGLLLNAALYAVYLLLTHMVIGSPAAMTATYAAGVLIGFVLNKRFSFQFIGDSNSALWRYLASYAIGYLINFLGLWVLVGRYGFAHEIVQGGMMLAIPGVLFLLQRYWVFSTRRSDNARRFAKSTP